MTNAGFARTCYVVPANVFVKVKLTDEVTNEATGLTVALDIAIATPNRPVVAQATISEAPAGALPGLTSMSGPVPTVRRRNALYISPTAPDRDPIEFELPRLDTGTYLLQLPTFPLVPSAVIIARP